MFLENQKKIQEYFKFYRIVQNLLHILLISLNLLMKQLEKSNIDPFIPFFFLNIICFSLLNIDNATSINFINPVNTLVTGEVIVERNEHISSKFYLKINFEKTKFF